MNNIHSIPHYLTLVSQLNTITISDEVELLTDDSGRAKTNKNFPDKSAYRIQTEILFGMREKEFFTNGQKQTIQVPDLRKYKITVWSKDPLEIMIGAGDVVKLNGLCVGAIDNNLFWQAIDGLEVIEENTVHSTEEE